MKPSRRRARRLLSSSVLLAASGVTLEVVLLLLWLWLFTQHRPATLPFDSPEMRRLTLPGTVTNAAIAPDGKAVVFLMEGTAGPSLWIRQLGLTQDRRVVALQPGVYQDLIYSPDGTYIYYIEIRNLAAILYRVRTAGSEPQKVLDDVTGRVSFSPDGKRLAFVRLNTERWEESLIVANADGSAERTLLTRRRPYYYSRTGVAWSSDGHSFFASLVKRRSTVRTRIT